MTMKQEERNYCVYMHTNKINGKKYVGLTCQAKPELRWLNGLGYQYNDHFFRAIKKYGWKKGFTHEVIQEGLTKEEACNLEMQLISEYNTTNPDKGYNITLGGEAGIISEERWEEYISKVGKKVLCVETGVIYESMAEATRAIGEDSSSSIKKCCTGERVTAGGYHWVQLNEDGTVPEINLRLSRRNRRVIHRETGIIYESASKASELTGLATDGIIDCCRGDIRHTKGTHWNYIDDNDNIVEVDREFHRREDKRVIDTTTGIIYKSARQASKALGFCDTGILQCCKHKQSHVHGHIFEYVTNQTATPKKERNKYNDGTPVRCIELELEFLSMSEAERQGYGRAKDISRVLDKPNRTCNGYHWERVDKTIPRKTTPNMRHVKVELTEEARKKIAESGMRKVVRMETKTIYSSLKEASEANNIPYQGISACCRGKQKTAGGFHWEYVNDNKPSESD